MTKNTLIVVIILAIAIMCASVTNLIQSAKINKLEDRVQKLESVEKEIKAEKE